MASEDGRKGRRLLLKTDVLGVLKPKSDKEPEAESVTVKDAKKKVKRVVKAKPNAGPNKSESTNAPMMSAEDVKITEETMARIDSVPEKLSAQEVARSAFACLKCGCTVPESTERCPKCSTLYIRDFREPGLEELIPTDAEFRMEFDEVLSSREVPCAHFDMEAGTVSYLENDTRAPNFEVECTHCGTLIGFDAERCPICGTKFDLGDTGLVSLFSDMEFDKDCEGEISCPLCGEKVVLDNGKCPSCSELVREDNPKDPARNVEPVIHNKNVVFLHLDVESGELSYLQRLARKLGFEQMTVRLNGIGRCGLDQPTEWKSPSRI